MLKDVLINKVILEMSEVLTEFQLNVLKRCFDRVFYHAVVKNENGSVDDGYRITNEEILKRFIFNKKLEGLLSKTLDLHY